MLDLGGVLADLRDPVAAMGLDMPLDAFWKTWTSSATVRAFETGQMSEAEFLRQIPAELGYTGSASFEKQFHAWQLELFPGVGELIRRVLPRYRVALLSNTNAIHWRQVTAGNDVFADFECVFLSYETGCFKPGESAFRQVTDWFECSPGDVMFLDDSEPNIAAALDFGMDARRVAGMAELERQLLRVTD